MKKLTINTIKYGPYNTIETLSDRYRCDGADLPFSVVGQGVISDVVDGDFPPVVIPVVVPQEVTPLQGLLAIDIAGMSTAYETWANDPTRTFAEKAFINRAQVWNRNDPLMIGAATALGMTSAQLDDLFVLAGTL